MRISNLATAVIGTAAVCSLGTGIIIYLANREGYDLLRLVTTAGHISMWSGIGLLVVLLILKLGFDKISNLAWAAAILLTAVGLILVPMPFVDIWSTFGLAALVSIMAGAVLLPEESNSLPNEWFRFCCAAASSFSALVGGTAVPYWLSRGDGGDLYEAGFSFVLIVPVLAFAVAALCAACVSMSLRGEKANLETRPYGLEPGSAHQGG